MEARATKIWPRPPIACCPVFHSTTDLSFEQGKHLDDRAHRVLLRRRLAFRLVCGRACQRLGALLRKDCGLAATAARGDCHAGDGLAALLQTPVCTKNLNASVLVMKSAKDAA